MRPSPWRGHNPVPMNSIFKGDVSTAGGRALAWLDALVVDHAVFRLVWSNFAAVAPGRLYRCNHPTPARLAALTRRYGLKTLINLRGETGNGSDALSREAAQRAGSGVRRHAPLDSRGAPQRERILRLLDIFRQMRAPALLHCKSGADRAGLAAGLFVLFRAAPRARHWRNSRCASAISGRRAPACWTRSSTTTRARPRGGSRSSTGCARTTIDAALRRDFHANGLASFINDWVLVHE